MILLFLPLYLLSTVFAYQCSSGTCQELNKCSSAQSDLKQGKKPEICGFHDLDPLVCCRDEHQENKSSKSERKCQEYSLINFPRGKRTKRQFVYHGLAGGDDVLQGEVPHMAILGYGPPAQIVFKCGGSLISELFVLTAAHCVHTPYGQVSMVRLGDIDISTDTDDADPQDFQVIETYEHPEYNSPSKYHDIALLKLDKPAQFSFHDGALDISVATSSATSRRFI